MPAYLYSIVAFFEENAYTGKTLNKIPVVNEDDLSAYAGVEFLPAVGDPKAKKHLSERADLWGLIPCRAVIADGARVGNNCRLGAGTIVCPGAVITCDAVLSEGVVVNIGATIGHDVVVGKYATISPGANISGRCKVGSLSYVGTGSAMREGTTVGIGATLGMGAVLTKHVPDGQVWAGNPAAELRKP